MKNAMRATITEDQNYYRFVTLSATKARDKQVLTQQITIIGMSPTRNGKGEVTISSLEPVIARWYMSARGDGASQVTCILWTPNGVSSGVAKGYGYHKPSAALADACCKAGIELSEDISGRGDDAMEQALRAIADASTTGITSWHVCKAHN